MQRKLFIIRHGKSSWESIVDDIDRPLTEKGVRNSYEMANCLKNSALIPEAIYTSPAARAQHTASIMSRIWEMNDQDIHVRGNLYLPDLEDIAELIFEVPDSYMSVAIFGHNPGFTQFANRFMTQPLENLPTAGIAVVTLEIDSWTDLYNGQVLDVMVDCPKKRNA
ncbi:MAG: histidine phosphatase family protein [Bacteroidales bacterium]|jgi:phosphohistidine phosphatase|nr:histidine phosphatase family protein [Bacteroidales bacterium]